MRWTFVLFFVSIGVFHAGLHADQPAMAGLKLKDIHPGDIHDGFAQPGERLGISLEIVMDFIPAEAYIICDSDFGEVESPRTRFTPRKDDTLINTLLEPLVYIKEDCPTDFTIPFNLIYRNDTTFDTLGFEIHTTGTLDSCYLDSKVNRPGSKVMIRALCTSSGGGASGYGSVIAVVKRGVSDTGDSIPLYDDGKHADGAQGDGYFGNSWWTLSNAYDYDMDIILKDTIMGHAHLVEHHTGFTTKWFNQTNPYIIISDPYDNTGKNAVFSGMSEAMDSLDLDYDTWNLWYRGFPDTSELHKWGMRKSILIWATDLGGTLKHTTTGKTLIEYFLEKGGRFFLATPYLGNYISSYGESTDSLFLHEVLSAEFVSQFSAGDSTRTFALYDPFTAQMMDTFPISLTRSDSGEFVSFVDVLHPIPPAISIVKEWSSDGDTINGFGVKIEKDAYRAIYLSFDLIDIEPLSLRKEFLKSCLEWIASETSDSIAYEPFGEEEPEFVRLADPYPNPFLYESTVPFTLLYGSKVNLVICDLSGRMVRRLINSTLMPGNYYAVWDGKDEKGEETAVGYYFVRLSVETTDQVGGEEVFTVVSRKLLKLRK